MNAGLPEPHLATRNLTIVDGSLQPKSARHGKSERTFIFELGKRQRTFEEQASTFGLAVSWAAQPGTGERLHCGS
jgi:hypothetical protein